MSPNELVERILLTLNGLRPSKRNSIDDIEVVFVDTVNGKLKVRRTYTILEMVKAIIDVGKPIGLLLTGWVGIGGIESVEFPDTTAEEKGLLLHALFEAQDFQEEIEKEEE